LGNAAYNVYNIWSDNIDLYLLSGSEILENLQPEKLKIEFIDGVTKTEPVIGRKYTLTHSDKTGILYLAVGREFAYDRISSQRDVVLAEWRVNNGQPYLHVYISLDDGADPEISQKRDEIFRRELPLALEAIRYGDKDFFIEHKGLDHAWIWVHFDSGNPEYNRFEYYGMPQDYN